MLAEMFSGAVKASFHRCDTSIQRFRYFGMTAAFLNQSQQGPVLRSQLRQRMAERIQFFRVHRSRRFRDVFVLFTKRQKNPPQFLPPQLIDASITGQAKKPRFELRRSLQPIQSSDHFDEDLLRQIFDVIASSGHGVNKPRHPMLVADDELTLGRFLALLRPADEVSQRSR